MKNWIFDFISDFGECFIYGVQIVAEFLVSIIADTVNAFMRYVADIFKMALWLIDRKRIDHAEQVIDQACMNNELEILMKVSRLKEDAIERKVWTNYHSIVLNGLSSKLYNECSWDKEKIHEYMRTIVESIPGLSYVATDEYEEEDDSIDLDD
jgi:hypothetical protein